MKTILFPTDFSPAARHALAYAVMLAQSQHARLRLLHSYNVLASGDMQNSFLTDMQELIAQTEKQAQQKMEDLKQSLLHQHEYFHKDSNRLEASVLYGFPIETIISEAEKIRPLCIVMGSQGAASRIERIFGSTTSNVMPKVLSPLFVIPEKASVQLPQQICYAVDMEDDETPQIEKIKELISHADLQVLHITTHEELIAKEKIRRLKEKFSDLHITFHHVSGENVTDGLEKYITETQPDLLALTFVERGFLASMFHHSITRYMTLTAEIPMLILHKETAPALEYY
jgi:nucleotide-binding universal stress UspA family protein